ncbi:uncharacterized protein LOC124640355 [Helicoverpa zea]|uniref:uncharacterized protein LOC124640355 n=1 Tax=Helicoverpa zea TaxID=7113 RepID=UPI001F5ACB4F|nr:uncharacterized protein LOC124640355 [Helicoverpa zea]
MCYKKLTLFVILLLAVGHYSIQFRFMRTIKAIGHPYYKILMTLGSCKEKVIFYDQKIYGAITLNRVLDIYFECDNEIKVSRVEIILIINNTSSVAFSERGVGGSDFEATLYLPTNVNFVIYALTIFTCSRGKHSEESTAEPNRKNMAHTLMPFLYRKRN